MMSSVLKSTSATGHLFVIDGDLQDIAVDAWLLPTDRSFSITNSWAKTAPYIESLEQIMNDGWQNHRCLFAASIDKVDVWLGDVGRNDADADHYLAVALDFITAASERSCAKAEREGRLPIVALNHLGTGHGGAFFRHGEILRTLIYGITDALNSRHVTADVVLVAWGEQPESASQYLRSSRKENWRDDPQWDFGDATELLHETAESLARYSKNGTLSVFLGAGTSMGAGLPGWSHLLEQVAVAGGVLGESETLHDLQDFRDQAALIDARLRKRGLSLRALLTEALSHSKYSLQHGLLASLPCNEFITTNVDELFEKACRTNQRSLTVMPNQEGDNQRWLLKLHGTVSQPDSMVFTRENYLDAGRTSRALLGLVQAMLFTRHMLFVGYGLADEDFHELVYEVKRAYGASIPDEPVGSVLLLRDEPMKSEIWNDFLRIIPVGTSHSAQENARDIARFLDLVGMLSAEKHRFFLDERYAPLIKANETDLYRTLRALPLMASPQEGDAWDEVLSLLTTLGWIPNT